eukprot:682947-Pleurochrysis_carterae.AAC.1
MHALETRRARQRMPVVRSSAHLCFVIAQPDGTVKTVDPEWSLNLDSLSRFEPPRAGGGGDDAARGARRQGF